MRAIEITHLSTSLVTDWWGRLSMFMSQGGAVLWVLALVVIVIWLLAIERCLFLSFTWPKLKQDWLTQWRQRDEFESWYAHAIKAGIVSRAHSALNQSLGLIKVLVTLCPMLGLLGTVTGMISVFDVMAREGNSEPALMASGISMATLPTMAGMVAALSGMFIHSRLLKAVERRESRMEKQLRGGESCV
ncbi:MotA/TolQ/ExbB proton channel family protein [Thaumasiovibrio sp. DFM-14]|uniref:MotA/TolQ/ExbB proton channel family protein n=1 Tax=Thaumasiovibrio sp. DFM-14 TaxID=3384792 RepID=UPI0039A0EE44